MHKKHKRKLREESSDDASKNHFVPFVLYVPFVA
jgi:hypothetical protein